MFGLCFVDVDENVGCEGDLSFISEMKGFELCGRFFVWIVVVSFFFFEKLIGDVF